MTRGRSHRQARLPSHRRRRLVGVVSTVALAIWVATWFERVAIVYYRPGATLVAAEMSCGQLLCTRAIPLNLGPEPSEVPGVTIRTGAAHFYRFNRNAPLPDIWSLNYPDRGGPNPPADDPVQSTVVDITGFVYELGFHRKPGGMTGMFAQRLLIPHWLVGLSFLAPLIGMQVSRIAAARRRRNGRCEKCGYDLRASPERCPECGEPR